MTTPTRAELLKLLAELSKECPAMRMGQLIANLATLARGAQVESIWDAVRSGMTAAACERKFPVDSYRIRRLLAYWIEKGALKVPGRKKETP